MGHRGRHVRSPPHRIGGLRGDRAVVCLRAVRVAPAVRGLEVVLPHEPPHPLLRGTDPRDPQLRPGFAVPFAMKRRGFKHPADVADEHRVRGGTDRPAATPRRACPRRVTPRVDAGPRPFPHAAEGRLSVAAFTHRVAERLHAEDPRWGRRVNVTGPISDDTVAYRVGISPLNPLSVDIVFRVRTAEQK